AAQAVGGHQNVPERSDGGRLAAQGQGVVVALRYGETVGAKVGEIERVDAIAADGLEDLRVLLIDLGRRQRIGAGRHPVGRYHFKLYGIVDDAQAIADAGAVVGAILYRDDEIELSRA